MPRRTITIKKHRLAKCLLVLCTLASGPAYSQQLLHAWPYSGSWRVALYQTTNGGRMCSAMATGHDPDGYSFSFLRLPNRLFLTYAEENSEVKHGPKVTISVDGKMLASFVPTINNNGLSTELPSGDGTEKFFDALGNGTSMTIDTGVAQRQISLAGFVTVLQNLVDCSHQLKS